MKTTVGATAALLVATALPLLGAGSAHAASNAVVRNGSCSANSSWSMKAKPDNGRLEVEAEVDSNRVGQTWHWVLRRNGNVAATGNSVTRRPSGSFTVSRRTGNRAGTDAFTLRAVNRRSGEVCRAHVAL
jgi:hypothetical protein